MFATAQEYDSAWIAKAYGERFSIDTGNDLTNMKFVDEKGNVKTLEGKDIVHRYMDYMVRALSPELQTFSSTFATFKINPFRYVNSIH